jgi:hypothetical protein
MVYAGEVKARARAVAPFRPLAEPVADLLRPMAYAEMYPDEQRSGLAVVARTVLAHRRSDHDQRGGDLRSVQRRAFRARHIGTPAFRRARRR